MGTKNTTKSKAAAKHSAHTPAKRQAQHRFKKWLTIGVIGVVSILVLMYIAFQVSPWPGALVIRAVFNHGGQQTLRDMEAKLPDYPVTVISDQHYRQHDKDALLDVYIPNRALQKDQTLPTVVWTHGGAWLSGNKKDAAPYFKRLADQGFVVVAPNYSLAPGKKYPTAVHQLNDAQVYIRANAARFHLDAKKIVLAGDSAGSQLSSQMAAIITNPKYAREVGIEPSLKPSQLAGVVLFCGIYKMEGLAEPAPSLPKIIDWGDSITTWAYSGTRDDTDPIIRQMSPYYHVTKDFPATFISGGNADPLTNTQSVPFAKELRTLGVPVSMLFYPADHTPKLPHEYQFTLNSDGKHAFARMATFLKSVTQQPAGQ